MLESCEPCTHTIRDKGSDSSKSKRLKSRKNSRSMWEISLQYTYPRKGYTGHQTRELKCADIKYIRNQWYKSDNHKRYQRPESDRERSFFTDLFTLGSQIGTDRHRCSVGKEIGEAENNNRLVWEISSCRTSHNRESRHRPINGSVHHLWQIMTKKFKHRRINYELTMTNYE